MVNANIQSNYTFQEYMTIFTDFNTQGEKILSSLNNRNYTGVTEKASRMGINPPSDVTDEEVELLTKYRSSLGYAVCFLLAGRSPREVERMAKCLNIVEQSSSSSD